MSILGKIGFAVQNYSTLGRAASVLTSRAGMAEAFKSTPLGGLVSGMVGGDDKEDKKDKKSGDAERISGSPASGLEISKETLGSLKAIDDNLKNLINALEDRKDAEAERKQKEEAAAEEKKTEENKAIDAEQVKGDDGGSGIGGMLKRFGKLAGIVAVLVVQFAYPLYRALMNLKDKFSEGFKNMKNFFVEKILPIFTEVIPEFFTETIPNFFTETLPEKFWAGVGWISDKFSSMADMFSGTVADIKKKIGDFIVGLSEKSVFDLFPDAQKKVRSFGEGLVKSGNATIAEISAKQKKKEADAQAAAVAKAKEKPAATADKSAAKAKEDTANKLTPFEKEFAKQRNLQGPGGVFSWTDPATGKTGTYTTDYAEENPASPVSKATIENSGRAGKELGSAPSSDTVDTTKPQTPSDASSAAIMKGPAIAAPPAAAPGSATSEGPSPAVPVASSTNVNIPSGGGGGDNAGAARGGGGGAASQVATTPTTGADVAAASMQATAPTPTPSAVAQQSANGMNKPKAKSEAVNPVANVPEVDVDLGSIANLWYHRAAA